VPEPVWAVAFELIRNVFLKELVAISFANFQSRNIS